MAGTVPSLGHRVEQRVLGTSFFTQFCSKMHSDRHRDVFPLPFAEHVDFNLVDRGFRKTPLTSTQVRRAQALTNEAVRALNDLGGRGDHLPAGRMPSSAGIRATQHIAREICHFPFGDVPFPLVLVGVLLGGRGVDGEATEAQETTGAMLSTSGTRAAPSPSTSRHQTPW